MEIFYLTLNQMITMFILIVAGYALRKRNILPEESHLTLSRLETYILVPALNIVTWAKKCNPQTLSENAVLVLYGMGVIIVAIALAYLLAPLFVKNAKTSAEKYQRNIYKYAMTFGNYGYVGNFIVLGVWGEEMFFKFSMFTICVAFVCSSWGLIILIPKDSGKVVSF
ncbi:MAG: AEC family transporter, partial [Clostridia bacterium]|nr:AEC family transporter [Clostridia bacterium]